MAEWTIEDALRAEIAAVDQRHAEALAAHAVLDLVRHDASDKALDKAAVAMEKRLDGMNEFRDQLREQASNLLPRSEYELAHEVRSSPVATAPRAAVTWWAGSSAPQASWRRSSRSSPSSSADTRRPMTAIIFAALVWQVVDFLRELSNLSTQKSAVVTQLCAWGGGVALVALGAHAAVTSGLVLPGADLPLGKLDWTSVVLVGLLTGSLASTGADLKQAIDRSDSAAKPPLVGPAAPPAV